VTHNPQNDDWRIPLPGDGKNATKRHNIAFRASWSSRGVFRVDDITPSWER